MATKEDLDALKSDWILDPCWDIEETEGFEDHRDELLAFSRQQKRRWKEEDRRKIITLATYLALPANLAKYIMDLERRIEHLEARGQH